MIVIEFLIGILTIIFTLFMCGFVCYICKAISDIVGRKTDNNKIFKITNKIINKIIDIITIIFKIIIGFIVGLTGIAILIDIGKDVINLFY